MTKSQIGIPPAEFVPGVELAVEARKARRRLLPVTVLYTLYGAAVVSAALQNGHPAMVFVSFLSGVLVWTLVEYCAHRYVLHGVFPDGPGLRGWLHRRFDGLHVRHHLRPWDGDHISGTIRDTLPFAFVLAVPSFLAPISTLPVVVASVLLSYVAEEWIHQSVHFYDFKGPYFRYIRRHHLYHHSRHGLERAFGLTSDVWDGAFDTRSSGERARVA